MSGPSGSQETVKSCFYLCPDRLSITEADQPPYLFLTSAPSEPLQRVGMRRSAFLVFLISYEA